MSVKELNAQGQGLTSFEMEKDDGIRQFERIARKYGVDYAVRKTKEGKRKCFSATDGDGVVVYKMKSFDQVNDKRF